MRPLHSLLLLLACILSASQSASAEFCPAARTSDVDLPAATPLSPQASAYGASLPLDSFHRLGCSEVARVYTQTTPYLGANSSIPGQSPSPPRFHPGIWPRDNCPHLASGLTPFEDAFPSLAPGQDVTLTAGQNLLLRGCMLPAASQTDPSWILRRILVPNAATLVLDDSPLLLRVREILVQSGGKLLAGSASCRLFSRVKIIFHGSASDSNVPGDDASSTYPSKGLIVNGQVDIHGKEYFPTWTRLARTAGGPRFNGSLLYLQEAVNWEVGQQILVTTSILLDCPPHLAASWCKPCESWQSCAVQQHQNEVRTIVALGQSPHMPNSGHPSLFSALQLDRPLQFEHYAGSEYQSEVALLSRRIEFVGEQSGDRFGGHTQVVGSSAEGRFSGVNAENMGQMNMMARYPFHFHMVGNGANAARSWFSDCTVTNSNFRAFVVHGSNRTRLSRNVGFNVTGMAVYLEDGVEELNLIEYNLMAHVHPIFRPANGGYGQGGETFLAQPGLLVPADTSASGFYSLNAHNSYIGNAASGGWSGFVFPNAPAPIGDFRTPIPPGDPRNPWQPMNRPLLRFVGNTAHSNGYHWVEHGSAMYVGAWLDYDFNGVLRYNSGRNERYSSWPDGRKAFDVFTDTKVWLTNKGIAHWGNNARIERTEMHDIRVSAMLFGQASMENVLVNGVTPNLKTGWVVNRAKMGFQFYDTWVQTILSGVTFRNYSSAQGQYAVRYMDHSDHYTPQGINAVRGIVWDNVDQNARVGIANCGPACGGTTSTMSSRIYSVWDWDGSMSNSTGASIMGSNLAWWNNSPEQTCRFATNLKVWVCDWRMRSTTAFIGARIAGLSDGCNVAEIPSCTDQYSPVTVGSMSQWGGALGRNRSVTMGAWPGVAGPSNTGWYWRTSSAHYGIDGAPSEFQIEETMQLAKGNFIVLAVAYPASTSFTVAIQSAWWGYTYPVAAASSLSTVLTAREDIRPASGISGCSSDWWGMCTNHGGVGPTYFFDGTHLYLRVVAPGCYNRNQMTVCENNFFTSGNVTIPSMQQGFSYKVQASCPGCAVQSTLGSVTFWNVTDQAPAARFPTDFGPVRASPPTLPAELVKQPTCTPPFVPSSSSTGAGQLPPPPPSSSTGMHRPPSSSGQAPPPSPVSSSTGMNRPPSSSGQGPPPSSSSSGEGQPPPPPSSTGRPRPSSSSTGRGALPSSSGLGPLVPPPSSSAAGDVSVPSSTASVQQAVSSTAEAIAAVPSSSAEPQRPSSSTALHRLRSSSTGSADSSLSVNDASSSSSTGSAPTWEDDNPVKLVVHFDREISSLPPDYQTQFEKGVGEFVGVSRSRVKVENIVSGSTIVTFLFLSRTRVNSWEWSPLEAAELFRQLYVTPSSSMMQSSIMASASSDPALQPRPESVYACADGSFQRVCPSPAEPKPGFVEAVASKWYYFVPFLLGVVLILSLGCWCIYKACRARHKRIHGTEKIARTDDSVGRDHSVEITSRASKAVSSGGKHKSKSRKKKKQRAEGQPDHFDRQFSSIDVDMTECKEVEMWGSKRDLHI